ncbi:Beige/BEACH domain containing protein [Trichomonas vaginalis G3]|uniref:Beige/BEACH domain containing protein n=1 Tax=Trichomonas vaginalis (strain ATCC PRA-98 / G3) TaxID=412133 RepID=A2DCQ3_TRIV3|nr:platelet formation protein family [Trichomonas vaginalis G3]EAY21677.1 Beige/BEACH domain containing protein [Trichomonas vaginalis G3]KAI5524344.1 platelet formation protein family [Trichomonas vaginalis G3]|eukprot:XP_001582663.1 Beige/BEACH domain containing protein [Trichomonas vaginalis G3]
MNSIDLERLDDYSPITNILQINYPDITIPKSLSEEIKNIFLKYSDKTLEGTEEIIKKLKTGVSVDEIKEEYDFPPPINYKDIDFILKYQVTENKGHLYIGYHLLRSAALWFFADKSYHNRETFESVFKSIDYANQIIYRQLSSELFMFYCSNVFHYYYDKFTDEIRQLFIKFINERRVKIAKSLSESLTSYHLNFMKLILQNMDIPTIVSLIQTFTDIFNESNCSAENLHKISSNFKFFIPKLKQDIESQQLSLCLLDFYTVLGKISQLTKEDSNVIYKCLIKTEDKQDPGYHIYKILKRIIVGKPGSTRIRNANIIFNFLQIFMHSSRSTDAFTFILNLCQQHVSNIIILSDNDVDYDLLNLIRENEHNLDMIHIIGLSLQLVSSIAQFSSTPKVVSRLLSLLKPRNGFLSTLHATYIVMHFNLVELSVKSPIAALPLGENKPTIFVESLPTSCLSEDFYIGFWLYVLDDTKDVVTSLFRIYDNKDRSYNINLIGNRIEFSIPENFEHFTFNFDIIEDKWTFVCLGMEKNSSNINVNLYVNDIKTHEIITVESLRLDKSYNVSLDIGSNEKGRCYLGPIGFFDKPENCLMMYKMGPRIFDRPAMLYIVPQVIKSNLVLSQKSNQNEPVKAVLKSDIKFRVPVTFFDILTRNFMLENLIPLFRTLDMKLESGDLVPIFSGAVIDIIIDSLSSSKFIEDEFVSHHGFEVIAECLSQSNQRNLIYTTYQKFYFTFMTSKNEKLKKVILKEILVNPDIWIHSTDQDQKFIVKDWGLTLYSKHYNLCKECCPFDYLLMILRIYYWYEPVEQEIAQCTPNSKYPRFSKISIKEIRQEIIYILAMISTKDFTDDMFKSLLAHTVACKDLKQVVDFLFLIRIMIVNEEQPFNKVENSWPLFNVLHHLVNSGNEDISFAAIETIAALHLLEHFSTIPVKYHVGVLIEELPLSSLSIDYFAKLIPLVNKYPDFYPLCFYYVLHEGEKSCGALIQYININEQFAKRRSWAFWPVVTALTFGGEFMEKIIEFIAKCTNEHWRTTFAIIDVVARVLKVDDTRPKSIFIHSVVKNLWEQPLLSFEYMHDFFDLCIFHLFFRKVTHKLSSVEEILHDIDPQMEYKNDDFDLSEVTSESISMETLQSTENLAEIRQNFNRYEFVSKLSKLEINDEYTFGLNLNKDGSWLDAECAIDVIKQARRMKVETYHNFSAMLAKFAYKDVPDLAKEQMEELINDNVADQMYIDMMNGENLDHTDCFERIIRDTREHNDTIVNYNKDVVEKIKHNFEKVLNGMATLIDTTDNSIFAELHQNILGFIADDILMHNFCNKRRETIENSVTTKTGPWFTPKSPSKGRMISRYNCYENIPMKMIEFNEIPQISDTLEYLRDKYMMSEIPQIPDFCEISFNEENENLKIVLTCDRIEVTGTTRAKLFVYSDCLEIKNKQQMINIDARAVKQILFRPIRHLPTGLEIFTVSNESYLLNLDKLNSLTLLSGISSLSAFSQAEIQTMKPLEYFKSRNSTEKWINHEITNFEYLMELNNISGRSFNDLTNYPVLPNFLALDAESHLIVKDFTDISNYDLSRRHVIDLLSFAEPFKSYSKNPSNVRDSIQSNILVPEYFVCIDAFRDVALPFGFNCSEKLVTLVYESFENDLVSESLPTFIDNFFGILQSKFDFVDENVWKKAPPTDISYYMSIVARTEEEGQLPSRLFSEKHPQRMKIEKDIHLDLISKIKPKPEPLDLDPEEHDLENITVSFRIDDDSFIYGTKDGYIVRSNPDIKKKVSEESIVCISIDSSLICVGCADCKFVVLYSNTLEYFAHFPFFTSPIKIANLSERFSIVFGSTSEYIFIYSLSTRRMIMLVETNKKAVCACMSNIYGIICFSFGKDLFTYTLNGDKLSSRQFEFEANHMEFISDQQKEILVFTDGNNTQFLDLVALM